MVEISVRQAQQLLRLDENKLLEQLGVRAVAAANAAPAAPEIASGPVAGTLGVREDMKELGTRILRRWNRVAYDLACGNDPDDASMRTELEQALHVSEAAAIGVLSGGLITIGLSGSSRRSWRH